MDQMEREFRRRQMSCAYVFRACRGCGRMEGESHEDHCPAGIELDLLWVQGLIPWEATLVGPDQCI